jgi:23S rRNA (adenine2503-C2)-methyltransferase
MLYSETKTTTMEKYLDNSKWNDINTTFLPLADVKASIKLTDGNIIEASGFKLEKRGKTEFHACVSTQVGCKFGCKMCVSGKNGWKRDLSVAEILHQIEHVCELMEVEKLHHIVFMGIGEPLDNPVFAEALEMLIKIDPWYAGRLSFATVGTLHRLEEFAAKQIPLNMLWLSLHAPNDTKRLELMPIAKKFKVVEVIEAGRKFRQIANVGEVRVNYLVYQGYNDSRQDAEELAELLMGTKDDLTLQLTEPNGDEFKSYHPGNKEDVDRFMSYLKEAGVVNTMYRFLSAGKLVDGSCGRLLYTPSSTEQEKSKQS